ncbi:MAG: hypothetical protein KF904_13760 [Rhodoblastus sp.]|nr:hypothetical protein [Rhodoblastus sp.]
MLSPFRIAALASALFLAGCGHVPVSTMWALRNFDGLSVDPAFLRAAVRVPRAFQPRPGGVKVVATWGKKGDPASERKVEIVLREASLSAEGPALAKENLPGNNLHVFRVAPNDVARLRALQAEIARAKAEKRADHGSLGMGADACRTGDLPDGPILMTTFLKMSDETGWLTVLKNVDLRTLASKDKPLEEITPPCGKLPQRVEAAG